MAELTAFQIATIIFAVASTTYQTISNSRRKKQIKEQQRQSLARTIEYRPSGSGQDIGVCYGYFGLQGVLVYANSNHYYVADGLNAERSIGGISDNYENDPENQILIMQHALSAGDIEGIVWVWLDDQDYNSGRRGGINVHEWTNGGTASQWVINQNNGTTVEARKGRTKTGRSTVSNNNRTERTAKSKFTGIANITSMCQLDIDGRPPWQGKPIPFFFGHGKKVRSIVGGQAAPSLSVTETFRRDAVTAFLDWLTKNRENNGRYGPGLLDAFIDLPSWEASQRIGQQIVQGMGQEIGSNFVPADMVDTLVEHGYTIPAGRTRSTVTYDMARLWRGASGFPGFGGINIDGLASENVARVLTGTTDDDRALRRYEANGFISSSRDYPQIIASFTEVMPGSFFFFSGEGRYKLVLPDGDTPEADQNVMDITPSRIVGRLTISHPDVKNVINQCRVRFANHAKNFALDDIIFPATNSALHNQLKAIDGGRVLRDTIDTEVCANVYHARSIAWTRVRTSRQRIFKFTMPHIGFALEQGDVVRIFDPDAGDPLAYARINSIAPNENWFYDIEAVEFDKDDFAWVIDDREQIPDLNPVETPLGDAQNVRASYNISENLALIQWDDPAQNSLDNAEWEIGVLEVGTDPYPILLGRVSAYDENKYWHRVPLRQGTFRYGVRAVGVSGARGAWVYAPDVLIDARALTTTPGAIMYFDTIEAGRCPTRIARSGDVLVDNTNNIMWSYTRDPWDESQGVNGIALQASGASVVASGLTTLMLNAPVDQSLIGGEAFISTITFDNRPGATNGQIIINLLSSSPSITVTPENNAPPAAVGNVGQTTQIGTQWWKKGLPLLEEAPSATAESGVLMRFGGVGGYELSGVNFNDDQAVEIPQSLTEGTAQIYVRRVSLGGRNISFRLSGSTTDQPSLPGQDFISSLEPNLRLLISHPTFGDLYINFAATDTTEPYTWTPANPSTERTEYLAWRTKYRAADTATRSQTRFVLVRDDRRVPNSPDNDWYKLNAAPPASAPANISDAIKDNIYLGVERGDGGIRRIGRVTDSTGPLTFTNALLANNVPPGNVAFRVLIIDASKRCLGDPLSPWIPFNFASGQDGAGREVIFTAVVEEQAPTLPAGANAWPYDRPVAPWYDGQPPDFSLMRRYVYSAARRVPGFPEAGDPKKDSWGDWIVSSRPSSVWGKDGEPGVAGFPGISRTMIMNKRVLVEPPQTGQVINPTNPNEAGEYAWLRRDPTTGLTTQTDINSLDELWDSENSVWEGSTLRISRFAKNGKDYRELLLRVPVGAIIVFTPHVIDATDTPRWREAWIDMMVVRAGLTRDIEDDSEEFVGFHLIPLERDFRSMPRMPAANTIDTCAFGFSWQGPDATEPKLGTERFWKLAAAKPANPVKTKASFGDGNRPSGWPYDKTHLDAGTLPAPTTASDRWEASRTRRSGVVSDWTVELDAPRQTYQYERWYRRSATAPDAPAATAWGTAPAGWSATNPGATSAGGTWQAWRRRLGTGTPSQFYVKPQDPQLRTARERLLSVSISWGTWEYVVPDGASVPTSTKISYTVSVSGGRAPYNLRPINRFSGRVSAVYRRNDTVSKRVYASDSSSPSLRGEATSTSPLMSYSAD